MDTDWLATRTVLREIQVDLKVRVTRAELTVEE